MDLCEQRVHIVSPGESLIGIALKYNISVAQLRAYNRLFGKNDLTIGQV
jgi:LysM repeat protein